MNKYKKVPVCIGFLLPVFLIYTIFLFVPLVQSAYYSLTSWNGVTEKVFVGLDNFKALFSNSDYWITFWNTIKLVVISLCIQIPVGLLLGIPFIFQSKRHENIPYNFFPSGCYRSSGYFPDVFSFLQQ